MAKIKERLSSLVKYITKDDKVMDVGCDHALLDIYLVENGILDKIYVGDVNPNALQNGIDNIAAHGLESKVLPILSYGIEKILDLEINTLILSGMGSKTIIDILSSPNLDKVYKLILQSNNNWGELRRFLTSKGYNIFFEEIVPEGKKTYINIVAIVDRPVIEYTPSEYEFGPILTKNKENLDYFETLYNSYEDIYYQSHTDEAKEKLSYLESIIINLKNL